MITNTHSLILSVCRHTAYMTVARHYLIYKLRSTWEVHGKSALEQHACNLLSIPSISCQVIVLQSSLEGKVCACTQLDTVLSVSM